MKKVNYMLHGADYNPEQWIETKEIWDEDMRLMKKAGVNAVSLGIFSWAELEVSEGEYDFSFMDEIMEKLRENDIKVILATPSGARPVWLSKKYPEVLRVNEDRVRILHSKRHNHCYTSPVYREKTANINRLLAERYKDNPALIGWHISNEYGGECHCELCQKAFRKWLKEKYENDIEKLNHEWWTRFWSHRFSDWDEIESPSVSIGETTIGGLTLDWKRFVTAQTVDFMKNEMKPLREITPNIPITTNMMPLYDGLDYKKFAKEIDMISWDCYPDWHGDEGDIWVGASNAFAADFHRSLKDQSFWLMESTPSIVNWRQVNILKKPGMNKLASLQNVAHGADSVQYFQWRKGRGCSEKFHGAVIDHYGKEDTRVFCDVAEVGESLKKLSEIVRSDVNSEAAILYDTENKWALDAIDGFKRGDKKYGETCIKHYYPFYKLGISMDVITLDHDFSKYKLLIIPMLYMTDKELIGRIERFVKNGGTVVATYMTGYVNENDLCYLGGFPAEELKDVFGIWAEDIDSLTDNMRNAAVTNEVFTKKSYEIIDYCELIHANTAEVLAEYGMDFYKGMPCLTKNSYGKGSAYYIAFRDNGDFLEDFYERLADELKLRRILKTPVPYGVYVSERENDSNRFIFIQNFNNEPKTVVLDGEYYDMEQEKTADTELNLERFGVKILKKPK